MVGKKWIVRKISKNEVFDIVEIKRLCWMIKIRLSLSKLREHFIRSRVDRTQNQYKMCVCVWLTFSFKKKNYVNITIKIVYEDLIKLTYFSGLCVSVSVLIASAVIICDCGKRAHKNCVCNGKKYCHGFTFDFILELNCLDYCWLVENCCCCVSIWRKKKKIFYLDCIWFAPINCSIRWIV